MIDREILSKRLEEAYRLLLYKGLIKNKTDLGKAIGRDHATISNALACRGGTMTKGLITRVADAFPDILNKEYLLTGEGSIELSPAPPLILSSDEVVDVGVPFSVATRDPEVYDVPYVPVDAAASFISSLDTGIHYIDESYPVVLTEKEKRNIKNLRVFDVRGDSMEPGITSGSAILTELIPPTVWHMASGVVVAVYDTTVTVKRIAENRLDMENYLVLKADNREYGKAIVELCDLRALFKALRIISAPIT